jgi:hypothetical protein
MDLTENIHNSFGHNFVWKISEDGTYNKSGSFEDSGTWKFGEGKTHLIVLSDLPGATEDHFEILRLKNKQLWLRHTHDIHITIIKYAAK